MKKLLFLLLLWPLFVTPCCAESLPLDVLGELGALEDGLSEKERAISGSLRLDGRYNVEEALRRLWDALLERLRSALADELRLGVRLFSLALGCAVCACLCDNGSIRDTIDRAGCCGAVMLVSGRLNGMLNEAGETVRRLTAYANGVLPSLFTAAAAGGAALSAPTRYAAACLAIDVMMHAAQALILPLIYAYYALSVSLSLYDNPVLRAVARVCKWGAGTAMTGLTMAFGAYLSLSGLIAGSADAVAVKTAKTVIARSLPVVGGLLADSAGVLLSAAALIRNSLGAFAMISVCALCVAPVAVYSVRLLILKAAAAASALLPEARLPGLIGDFGTVFGMLLGLIGCCAAMLLIAIVSGLKAVSPL